MDSYNIFVGHRSEDSLKILIATLGKIGHRVAGTADSSKALVEGVTEDPPDLVLSCAEYADGDGIEALIEISKHVILPGLVVAKKENVYKVERAMDDHVMAYLVGPVTHLDLTPAIEVVMRRFKQFQDLHEENSNLKEALATRKKLERAKGILMAKNEMTEEQAYLKLRDIATSKRVKLAQVADIVIESEQKKNE